MQVQPIQAFYFRDFPNTHIPEILEEIYLHEIYKPFLLGKKDQIIVDLGANIGLFTYYAKDYAKTVYAVEPAKEHQEVIRELLEFNKITNVVLCPVAISNKTGREKFYHSPNTTAHSLGLVYDPKDFEEIESITFDKFWENNKLTHVDLLKLDCEGEEGKVISSLGFEKYAPYIKNIVFEWHAWGNLERHQFANTLTDLGFKVNWLPNMKAAVGTAIRI